MQLNTKQVSLNVISILITMLIITTVYELWLKHFIDWVTEFYLPHGECESGDMAACETVMSGLLNAQLFTYAIFIFVLYFSVTFSFTNFWYKNRSNIIKSDIVFSCLLILVPLLVYGVWGAGSISSVLIHWLPIVFGFTVYATFNNKTQHNKAIIVDRYRSG